MRIFVKIILFTIVALILIILLASCSVKGTINSASKATSDGNKTVAKNTTVSTPMAGIEVQSPVTLSNSVCTFNEQSVNVRLKMVEGRYYEDWNPGAYMGTYWEGNFVIELTDESGKIISITDISKMFPEPLVFKSSFNIEFDDYNNDGDLDFTIGQYASSNGNLYRIFTLRKSGKIEELPIKDHSDLYISKSTGYYSTKLNKINGTTFEMECYDNSVSATFHNFYKWDGKQFVLEKNQKVTQEKELAVLPTNSKDTSQSTSIVKSVKKNNSTFNNAFSNPIDEYFIPRINNASCEAGRRAHQDTYRGVWKSEFENIMKWMDKKCKYQKDKDNLIAYENSVEQLIDSTYAVVYTDLMDNYKRPPDSHERNLTGNGTRSALNQIQGEIYRDAGMKLIDIYDKSYTFLDYSKEHYE